jgi:hypothetical protein
MAETDYNKWSKEDLLLLDHNNHEEVFYKYIKGSASTKFKQKYLHNWIKPRKNDYFLECGSSSGKTCIDLSLKSGCRTLGIDFDANATEVSNRLKKKFFSDLKRCSFIEGDLETIIFDKDINKIIMADFSEHIPDRVFKNILDNIKNQLPYVTLYIYTPLRTHFLDILRHKGIILKRFSGHINVKTKPELINFLESNCWKIESFTFVTSYLPIVRNVENFFIKIPFLRDFFARKIAIIVRPVN